MAILGSSHHGSLGAAAGLAIAGLCLISAGILGPGTRGELLGASAVSQGLRGVGGEAAHGQAKMMALCEGHFLDTATGIPETDYSTLSHPASMQGWMPARMIAPRQAPPSICCPTSLDHKQQPLAIPTHTSHTCDSPLPSPHTRLIPWVDAISPPTTRQATRIPHNYATTHQATRSLSRPRPALRLTPSIQWTRQSTSSRAASVMTR